jgi:hypothetical protein
MKILTKILGVISLISVTSINAAVIYDNGSYSESGALEVGQNIGADDFILSSAADVTGAQLVIRDDLNNAWNKTTLNWYIFNDSVTMPGTQLHSGSATSILTTSLGASTFSGKELLEVSFDFGSVLSLSAGTEYWFGLNFGQTTNGVQWLISNSTTGSNSVTTSGVGSPFSSSAKDVNFKLITNVPEPSIIALFGAGLLGLGFARRRKLRQS